ncbi:GNAT family N-acetyltransferase [Kangiella sp. HZ709]|uniref:GNAT family N-acetyltransferase n=1 Tax=Kangiella sp. HZ709 TaxID=2666328 RepID=UPI0012B0D05C|nr:GNAT family N-acetyltransferase [Kangiella sp. HZ709]MRX27563.1 GNAT family N-acetyltransferase [Kangiella sp. HZ709]
MQWQFDGYSVDTDIDKLDIECIHQFLDKESTWANGISKPLVEKSIRNSINFGLYRDFHMVGYARVITDKATFANMVDVFVMREEQGKGLSHYLMQAIDAHPDLQNIRRFTLATWTAKFLYEKYGFTELNNPSSMMERYFPNIYQENNND